MAIITASKSKRIARFVAKNFGVRYLVVILDNSQNKVRDKTQTGIQAAVRRRKRGGRDWQDTGHHGR